jgi:hypothetical protein
MLAAWFEITEASSPHKRICFLTLIVDIVIAPRSAEVNRYVDSFAHSEGGVELDLGRRDPEA